MGKQIERLEAEREANLHGLVPTHSWWKIKDMCRPEFLGNVAFAADGTCNFWDRDELSEEPVECDREAFYTHRTMVVLGTGPLAPNSLSAVLAWGWAIRRGVVKSEVAARRRAEAAVRKAA